MTAVKPTPPHRSEFEVDVGESFDSADDTASSAPSYKHIVTEPSVKSHSVTCLSVETNSQSSSCGDFQDTEQTQDDPEDKQSTETSTSVSVSPDNDRSSVESSHNSHPGNMASAFPDHSGSGRTTKTFPNQFPDVFENSCEINRQPTDWQWTEGNPKPGEDKLYSTDTRRAGQNSNFTTSNTASNTATSYGTSRQTTDPSCKLTVKEKSKVEREISKKQRQDTNPSKVVVVFKWIVTIFIGLLGLACLIASRVSFVAIAVRLQLPDNPNNGGVPNNSYAFTLVTMILLIPNLFNLLRSMWMGLTRKDMPWPSKRSIIWIVGTSVVESFGICLFAFKIFGLQFGVTGLAVGGAVLLGPVVYLIYRRGRSGHPSSVARTCGIAAVLLMVVVIVAIWRAFSIGINDGKDIWHFCAAILCLTITWIPKIQKRLISLSTSSGGPAASTTTYTQEAADDSETFENHIESGRFQASQKLENVVENTQNVLVYMETRSFWKSGIIMSACRIPSIILFSVVLYYFDTDKAFTGGALESFRDSWNYLRSDTIAFNMFIVNIICTLVGYFLSLVACRINMQRGAFVLPLALSTPGVMAILSGYCSSSYFFVEGMDAQLCNSDETLYVVICSVLLFVSVCLSFGWIIWTTGTITMCSESEVFWSPTYPGVMLHEWLLVSRRNRLTENQEPSTRVVQKTKVYICTTMYRETRDEMEQLLKSIARVKDAKAHSDKYFESHVFFDGGVKEKTPTDFALQLVSLLPETLGVDTMMCTRSMTAYGMKLSWQLLATGERRQARGMTFTIHLKDNRKVKNKKRWSQIMYMSYVLDFLVRQYIDSSGSPQVDENNAFILTTDADVNFTPESVEALLDLMTRDRSVGAVCARTHPVGFGPLVWYQKFEYAIGHWFQKAAEHVLGSVLCAPGCFSVYRVSAVRDIVSTYSSNVEKAFEFLTKDMGEDRWFCTLLVQSGWRIEYCAASENKTQCPEEFEEFYKQRRRWIASTIANLLLLVREWKIISKFNQRVSLLFTIYQGLLLFSTLIGPSVVILVVSGGLVYAWNISSVTTIILQCLTCVGFTLICLYFSQTTQMKAAKILTFLYACVMMAVAVGTAQQVVQDITTNNDGSTVTQGNDTGPVVVTISPSDFSVDIPFSLTTLYLGSLISIFLIAGILHLREITCLIHGFWYLICLPSGYLILNIYSVCNITDRSWGTREEKQKSVVKDTRPWYEIFGEQIQKIFICCQRPDKQTHTDSSVGPARVRHTSVSDNHHKSKESVGDLSKTVLEEESHPEDLHHTSPPDDAIQDVEDSYFEDDVMPQPVEDWLDADFKDYIPLFKKHGFDSTLFISAMKEKDLVAIGIKQKSHITYLMDQITALPDFRIEVNVPENVRGWLRDIGLEQYCGVFKSSKIISSKDLEILKSFSRKEIESDLKITKAGHVVRLLTAIKHLRNPTEEELKRMEVKKQLSSTECYEMEQINQEENGFWKELTDACLKPGSVAFGHTEELKEKLSELRNNFLGVSAVANTLWLILLATLASKMELKVSGTDPVGLVFLSIFGFLLVLQFLCMLVHRLSTFGHFCARAPYRFGHQYNSSWRFSDQSLNFSLSDEDRQALNDAKEGDKKIKARLVARKRNKRKQNVSIFDETQHLLKDKQQTSYI